MAPEIPILQKGSHEPYVEQIAAHFAALIHAGRLRHGERLPPIRTIATETGVTRATVQAAYRRLSKQGLVAGIVGRGTSVVAEVHADAPRAHGITLSPGAAAALSVQ